MRYAKLLLPLVLITFFISCSLFSNKEGSTVELKIQTEEAEQQKTIFNGDTLVFIPTETLRYDFPPFISKVENQQIIIKGYLIKTGLSPVQGKIIKENNDIIITVYWKNGQTVPLVDEAYFYTAYISGLSSGVYDVKIIHKLDILRGGAKNYKVFDRSITVGGAETK